MRTNVLLSISAAFDQRFVNLVDSTPQGVQTRSDVPNQTFACPALQLRWNNANGDWRDAADVVQGTAHYASGSITGHGEITMQFDVAELVKRLLVRNTGIHVEKFGSAPAPVFADRNNADLTKRPQLNIVTTNGTFAPPCVATVWIANGTLGLRPSGALKFDLSGVVGTVQSATLSLRLLVVYAGTVFPLTIGLNYLDMPRIIYDPANELGGVTQGIAATVSQDRDLYGDPRINAGFPNGYTDFTSAAVISSEFVNVGLGVAVDPEMPTVPWPEYGLTALRLRGTQTSIATLVKHAVRPDPYKPEDQENMSGPDEMYFRYGIMLEEDVFTNHFENGTKLPGLDGTYIYGDKGAFVTVANRWSARTEHGGKSNANPGFFRMMAAYWYGGDWPESVHSGVGMARWTNLVPVCIRTLRKYWVEQYVKLNTFVGSAPNSDGILRLWVDGVKVHEETNIPIRLVPQCRFAYAPYGNVYHGGGTSPKGPIHYQIAGFAASTQYIGPAKRIA